MDPHRDPVFVPRYRSRFGGLWTDLTHAKALAEGKLRTGVVTEPEYADLLGWIDRGYVVLRGGVDPGLIDALDRDLEQVWTSGHPKAWVSLVEGGVGHTRPLEPDDHLKPDNLVKLLDAYEFLESAREVMFAPRVQRFLELIFERPVLAQDSLSFYRGSKQPIHRDTAFVKVSSPMEFAASWIALEDIHPGSGELEYYPGSHTWPDFLFDGRYKWWAPGNQEADGFYAHLQECASERGVKPERLLAKKGDVFIWAADLGHGGSAYTDPTRTRKSLVTHYSPLNCYPMYFHYFGHSERIHWRGNSHYCYQEKFRWTSAPDPD
jgi:hypothetical protein